MSTTLNPTDFHTTNDQKPKSTTEIFPDKSDRQPKQTKSSDQIMASEEDLISIGLEKRQRQYQSAPKAFSYDKPVEISVEKIKSNSILKLRTSSSGSVKKEQQQQQQSSQSLSKQPGEEESQQPDRIVSTSISESLDHIFKATENKIKEEQNKRLSMLREETSRPTSAIYSPPTLNSSLSPLDNSIPNTTTAIIQLDEYFEDGNFIQFNSQDLQYENKKKVAKVIGRYVKGEVLGEGSYAKVKEGFCIETLKRVAIKIMKHVKLKKIPGGEQNVKREIQMLKRLRHENVVELMDVIYNTEKQKIYVVFEYCATTLQEIMTRAIEAKLPTSQAQRYFIQFVKGLGYLHSKSIIHRDIKPGNLLVTMDDVIKISDFGVAEEISLYEPTDTLTSSLGSPAFQPPEIAAGQDHFSGFKVDIWASGVTLFNMVSGKLPFDGETIYALFDNIAKGEYKIPNDIEHDPILKNLITGMLKKEPKERYSLGQISDHTWLKVEIRRSPMEVPVIPVVVIDKDSQELANQPSTLSPSSAASNETEQQQQIPHGHISNSNFAYDTTLIPYLESMFDDLPVTYRRSSVVERLIYEKRMKAKKSLLRRLTTPNEGGKRSRRPSRASTPSSPSRVESDRSCRLQ